MGVRPGADRFDYLVNNAGISNHSPFEKVTKAELGRMYEVNFKCVYFLTQKLVSLLRDGGQIINISSSTTRFVNHDNTAYAPLKGAVEVLTRYLAHEFGARKILVNAVAPGPTQTDFNGGIVRDNPHVNEQVSKMTALQRPGEPDDIGEMVASFLGDANRWITGQRIEVSGGFNL